MSQHCFLHIHTFHTETCTCSGVIYGKRNNNTAIVVVTQGRVLRKSLLAEIHCSEVLLQQVKVQQVGRSILRTICLTDYALLQIER